MSSLRLGGKMKSGSIVKTATLLTQTGALLTGFLILAAFVLSILWDVEKALLLGGAFGCLLVLLLPALLSRCYDVFQPLSFAILSVAIGVTGRTVYILFNPDGAVHLLLGKDPEFMLPAILIMLIGSLFFVIGYMHRFPRMSLRRFKIVRSDVWDTRRLWIIVGVFTVIAIIAEALFLQRTGFQLEDITSISRKRFILLPESELGYTALGYLRWAASLSQIAFMLVMAWFISSGKRWFSAAGLAVVTMFGIAASFPFLTSARGALLWLIISSIIMWHYLRRPLSTRTVVVSAILSVAVLSVLINLRRGDVNVAEGISVEGVAERLFGSRDLLDITTTAHIITAIQEGRLDYSYGWTYLTWLYAPIPRIIWLEKPVVSVGWVVRGYVFGFGGMGGTPPGSVGEAFWAFGWFGVIIIMLALGGIEGSIYRSLGAYVHKNKNMALVYAFLFLPWSFSALGGGWSNAVVGALEKALPLMVALYFITPRSKVG